MANRLDKECLWAASQAFLYLKMRDKGTLKKEADQTALTVKTMLWLCNLGSVEYWT